MNRENINNEILKKYKVPFIIGCCLIVLIILFVGAKVINYQNKDYFKENALGDTTTTLTRISCSSVTVTLNSSTYLTVTAHYDDGTTKNVTYSSNISGGNGIVRFPAQGYVQGIALGSTTINISYTENGVNKTTTCTVTVEEDTTQQPEREVSSISITNGNITMTKGETKTLNLYVEYTDGTGESVAPSNASWSTNASTVATVSNGGVVSAVGLGNATIVATYGGKYSSITVEVIKSIESIAFDNPKTRVVVGEVLDFSVKANYSDGSVGPIASSDITWSSSDSSVISVVDGVITSLQEGTATITASYVGFSSDVPIEVVVVDSISISPVKLYLAKDGDSENVIATVKDSEGNALEGLELEVTGNRYTTVTANGYVLNTKSLSTGEVTDTIKVCVSGTDVCTNYQAYIYCKKWTLENGPMTFNLGYSLGEAHVNWTCTYRDLSDCTEIRNSDGELTGYRCAQYYNRCCGTIGGDSGDSDNEACYIKRGNETQNTYCFGTSTDCSGYTEIVEGVGDSNACDEPSACYQTSNGEYVTGKFSGQNGYTYIGTSCPVTPPVEENPACYVNNSTGSYQWAITSPGEGYEIDSSITSASACKKPETPPFEEPVCYVNKTTGDYQWSTTSPGEGYEIDSSITNETACILPELPACYKDASNNYVWGTYFNDDNYTLVADKLTEDDCHEIIDVPITSLDIKNIIYVFVVILLSFGIYVIYYSYSKKKNK